MMQIALFNENKPANLEGSPHGSVPERNVCMLKNYQLHQPLCRSSIQELIFSHKQCFFFLKQFIPSIDHVSALNAIFSSLDVTWNTMFRKTKLFVGPPKDGAGGVSKRWGPPVSHSPSPWTFSGSGIRPWSALLTNHLQAAHCVA